LSAAIRSALANPEQALIETRALAIHAGPDIAAAMAATAAMFRADANAALTNQDALITQSVAEHFFHAALMAASETPHHPRFVWTLAQPHRWLGLDVPGSRFGQDNPDNCYRIAAIDSGWCYEIRGRFFTPRPGDFSICALPGQIGENIAADVVGVISPDSIDVDADGGFAISVDATPSAGRRNHLCIAGARTLQVRDTLVDWARERPTALAIAPVGNAATDDYDFGRAAGRAAQLGTTIAAFFLKHVQHGMCEVAPVNTLPAPISSASRGGLVTQVATLGYYVLGDDEAMLITADRLGARYVGIQIADMWMISFDYRHHTSSLNHLQAMPDTDGRYRWVISRADPGVWNWLDSGGHSAGSILLRWQHLPPAMDLAGSVTTAVVPLADLPRRLPDGTRFVDADGRREQQAARHQAYLGRVS
jgi:hypothetical protein